MATITAQTTETTLSVSSPYHPALPSAAKALGGRWDSTARRWQYDRRDGERVAALYRQIYGEDWTEPVARVTVLYRVPLSRYATCTALGRELARRWTRDEPVRLGPGVTLVAGGFPRSGGSRAHPRLDASEGTVLLVRDVPVGIAAPEIADGYACTVPEEADPRTLASLAAELSEPTITPEDTLRTADLEERR